MTCSCYVGQRLNQGAIRQVVFAVAALTLACHSLYAAGKKLDIYFINPEDGNAVLVVSPSGESMLLDSAVPMQASADRILAAMQAAGIKQIDYLVTSHYDNDHFGAVKMLAEKVPILNFVDHGPPMIPAASEKNRVYLDYVKARAKGKEIVPQPREKIGIQGIDAQVVTNQGRVLSQPWPARARPTRPAG